MQYNIIKSANPAGGHRLGLVMGGGGAQAPASRLPPLPAAAPPSPLPASLGILRLQRDAAAGNRSAHDALGDHFYRQGQFGPAAGHYGAALAGALYELHPRLSGARSLLSMYERHLILPGSQAHRLAALLAGQRRAAERRARVGACTAAVSGLAGGLALIEWVGWHGPLHGLAMAGCVLLAGVAAFAARAALLNRRRGWRLPD